MELADRCRHAARDAVADVEPPSLGSILTTILDDASMVPSAVAVETAQAVADGLEQSDATRLETAVNRAVGVQLIYEGLRLTRRLAHEEPWRGPSLAAQPDQDLEAEPHPTELEEAATVRTASGESPTVSDPEGVPAAGTEDVGAGSVEAAESEARSMVPVGPDPIDADLEMLAADILVARGFYLLARTTAADKAVRTVRAFGREQMRAREGNDETAFDRTLERDIVELAVLAGAAAVDRRPTPHLFALADRIVDETDASFAPVDGDLLDPGPLDEVTATERATSVSDP